MDRQADRERLAKRVEQFVQNWQPTLDTLGHKLNFSLSRLIRDPSLIRLDYDGQLDSMIKAVSSKTPLAEAVSLYREHYFCYSCGADNIQLSSDGLGLFVSNPKPCLYPEPVDYSLELDIRSGHGIIANDLSTAFSIPRDYEGLSLNSMAGRIHRAKAMAAIGCIELQCTSSGVYLYKQSKRDRQNRQFLITRHERSSGVELASVTVDACHYCIVDADEYKRRGCEGKYKVRKFDMKPGVYNVAHHYETTRGDSNKILTHINWVRESDPIN